jgi:hypothetical protein
LRGQRGFMAWGRSSWSHGKAVPALVQELRRAGNVAEGVAFQPDTSEREKNSLPPSHHRFKGFLFLQAPSSGMAPGAAASPNPRVSTSKERPS